MNKIHALRIQNNLSQSEFAKIIGVSQQSIHKYETGSSIPKIETLAKIAKLFNITIDNIMPINNDKSTQYKALLYVSNDEKEIIEVLRALGPETKQYIKQALNLTTKELKTKENVL